jgi:hypothetical protein
MMKNNTISINVNYLSCEARGGEAAARKEDDQLYIFRHYQTKMHYLINISKTYERLYEKIIVLAWLEITEAPGCCRPIKVSNGVSSLLVIQVRPGQTLM